MDEDHNQSERLRSETPSFQSQQTNERTGSMSLGPKPQIDDAPEVVNGAAVKTEVSAPAQPDPFEEQVNNVINSEIGVQTLLNRLKQSIASAKEFALFLKKRSTLEEEHANGLRKICRITHENLRRPEHRQGSFAQSYDDITRIHERMADNGIQFAASLHQMHEDLLEMASNIERGRKHWKQTGLTAEQRLADTEVAMRKSKSKYDAVADDYDRARTGGGQSGKKFGLKGPKSAAQHEEDLLRKVHAADGDYASRVQLAQSTRAEHLSKGRPDTIKNIQDLIRECDSALTLQMQKFATFTEKLLLQNGMSVSPIRGQTKEPGKESRSLREAVSAIDNQKDLSYFIASQASTLPPRPMDIKYERHPVLSQGVLPMGTSPIQRQPESIQSFNSRQGPPTAFNASPLQSSPIGPGQNQGPGPNQGPVFNQGPAINQGPVFNQRPGSNQGLKFNQVTGPNQTPSSNQGPNFNQGLGPNQRPGSNQGPVPSQGPNLNQGTGQNQFSNLSQGSRPSAQQYPVQQQQPVQQHERSFSQGAPAQAVQQNAGPMGRNGPGHYNSASINSSGPPQLSALPFQTSSPLSTSFSQASNIPQQAPGPMKSNNMLPTKPVFGISLEQLFERDSSAVPLVVYQCIQAVDLYGLEVEGIYRLSGTASHVNKLKSMFDNDASRVDFRNPENFFHDLNSVAGLLKQFFRELPDPLLTSEHYQGFIDAAKNDDDIIRRDSLHAIINSLPDPNYATLRALTLHLNRVQENSSTNRMNGSNLAIVFGPTLMGANTGSNIQDAGWQVRVIDTILSNTYQIFDDD